VPWDGQRPALRHRNDSFTAFCRPLSLGLAIASSSLQSCEIPPSSRVKLFALPFISCGIW
jgi:hypothetical protein